jgi:hypothetical protein
MFHEAGGRVETANRFLSRLVCTEVVREGGCTKKKILRKNGVEKLLKNILRFCIGGEVVRQLHVFRDTFPPLLVAVFPLLSKAVLRCTVQQNWSLLRHALFITVTILWPDHVTHSLRSLITSLNIFCVTVCYVILNS